jgi:hypothetical protein
MVWDPAPGAFARGRELLPLTIPHSGLANGANRADTEGMDRSPKQEAIMLLDVSALKIMERVTSPSGCSVSVVHVSYGIVPTEDVLSGKAKPVEATLTGDGRTYDPRGWHSGPEAESVRVERWSTRGLEFHGFIDSASRKLVQVG